MVSGKQSTHTVALVAYIFLATGSVQAQDIAWQFETNGSANSFNSARSVTVDMSGDVIAAGDLFNSGTLGDFTVIKLSGSTGAELWRQEIDGSAGSTDLAVSVTVDCAGNVIATGTLNGADFTVIKFAGSTGVELWRHVVDGAAGVGASVVADGSGNLIAAGRLFNSGTSSDFTVVKLSGSTGAELWRQEIDGSASENDNARSVTVDAFGDVIAAGVLTTSMASDEDFAVIKLSGLTGTELWRQVIDGSEGFQDSATQVVVDGSGDVIAAGRVFNSVSEHDFAVVKLSGSTGTELWRHEIDGTGDSFLADEALSVTVDGSGDVIAAGLLDNAGTLSDFTVIKFSGSTGAELWCQQIDGTLTQFDGVSSVAVDASGDVIAAGRLELPVTPFEDFMVIKFFGSTGVELWRRVLKGTVNSRGLATSVALDGVGDVIAAGFINTSNSTSDFAVIKLFSSLNACPADIVDSAGIGPDGFVNVFDLLNLLANWGPCGQPCSADITDAAGTGSDGFVDVFDLLELLANWGPCS